MPPDKALQRSADPSYGGKPVLEDLGNIEQSHWECPLSELRTAFEYPGTRAWWAKARTSFSGDLRDFIEREILTEKPNPPFD